MKQRLLLSIATLLVLGACKSPSVVSGSEYNNSSASNVTKLAPVASPQKAAAGTPSKSQNNTAVTIEKVPYVQGVSSISVERMAKQNQCESKEGAGLLTPKGPVEVYRVECDNGQVFMARCELRQCSKMASNQQ